MRCAPLLLAVLTVLAACAPSFDGEPLGHRAAPAFTLTDQRGLPWSLSAQHGKVVALYFGYTHCPDDCPLTLAKLSRAIATLGPHSHAEIAFVTVDPQRDTPSVLRAFISHFHGATIAGLTGSRASLARVYRAYDIWSQALAQRKRGGYEVAHATPVYLIDRNGMLRVLHDDSDTVAAFEHDLAALGA
ncbi:MAG: SCO family protein [Candidatus Tyrphobacter sp.]